MGRQEDAEEEGGVEEGRPVDEGEDEEEEEEGKGGEEEGKSVRKSAC
jgi:hypothetical protein